MLDQVWLLSTVAARTAIVLVVLVVGLRLLGKRDLGAMNLIDVVMILLLGNAVQNSLTYGSGMLSVGLVSAFVLLLLERQLGILAIARPRLERVLRGHPTVLAVDGRLDEAAMRREHVTEDELMAAVREMGLSELDQTRLIMLEPNGEISVIPKDEEKAAGG